MLLIKCIFYGHVYAQKIHFSGTIIDEITGEKIPESWIFIKETSELVKSNKYGYFSLKTNKGKKYISIGAFGYSTAEYSFSMEYDTVLIVSLKKMEFDLQEIVVKDKKESIVLKSGDFFIPIEQIKKIPALLGENDVLKSLQLLPGVQSGTEGSAGIYVRGGSPDQTLILIDGVPVYNVYHLFGFFSVFNPDAISNIKLYKNELPALYGGRLSAVVDIQTKEGNLKEHKKKFSISPITSKFNIEGPIKRDESSYIISARQTWLNLLVKSFQALSNSPNRFNYGFYDINSKVNFKINKKSHIYASFYSGKDTFNSSYLIGEETSNFGYNWGNITGIFRWNYIKSQNLFRNTTVSFTNYSYNLNNKYNFKNETYSNNLKSNITDIQIRNDWDYFTQSNILINSGVVYTLHHFKPNIQQISGSFENPEKSLSTSTWISDIQGYIQKEIKFKKSIIGNIGVHYNGLLVENKIYQSVQPRLSTQWQITPTTNIRSSFFTACQYLHLLTNSSLGLPTDLWVPITSKVPPQYSYQWTIGASHKTEKWDIGVDFYTKRMKGVIEYQEGSSFLNDMTSKWYDKVVIGQGTSKGIEIFGQKKYGKTNVFLSYTLSWTNRFFEELNGGKEFPYKYDRRHVLSLSMIHKFRNKKQLSTVFTLQSGSMTSLPTSRLSNALPPVADKFERSTFSNYLPDFYQSVGYISNRNNFRLPIYHRLDINYETQIDKQKRRSKWVFSVYNFYNHANAFFIFYETTKLKKFSLLPILPSIAYEYSF